VTPAISSIGCFHTAWAHSGSYCGAATCPELGANRKGSASCRSDAIEALTLWCISALQECSHRRRRELSWQSTTSRLFALNGRSSALPSIHSTVEDFTRATASIATLRSMPTNRAAFPRCAAKRATTPVSQAMSSTLSLRFGSRRSSRSFGPHGGDGWDEVAFVKLRRAGVHLPMFMGRLTSPYDSKWS
jgi:hypothetical protein